MYDTVHLRLGVEEAGGVCFMDVVPPLLSNAVQHTGDSWESITGNLDNMRVSVSERAVKVEGSICKICYTDNFDTSVMDEDASKEAIEILSDSLRLDFSDAVVSRLDAAVNIETDKPVTSYLHGFGRLSDFERVRERANTLYYHKGNTETICIYDKVAEAGKDTPPHFIGCNVLRFEQRVTGITQQYGSNIKASTLYDPKFYKSVKTGLYERFRQIEKATNIQGIDKDKMKEDAKTRDAIALFLLYESMGGKVEVLDEIKRLQENRCYTKKQAYDERKKVERAYRRAASLGLLNEYGFMRELDDKMKAILLGS